MKKNPLTSQPSSNDLYISWVIDKSWLMQESSGLKPDWFWDIKSFSMRKENFLLYNNLPKTFPHIRRRKTDL